MKNLLFASFFIVLGIIFGLNLGALRNVWDFESGSLEKLDKQMAKDKSMRLVLIILTEKGEYQINRLGEDYQARLQILQKVKK